MGAIRGPLREFIRNQRGLEVVEWAIIAGLITVGLIATLAAIGLWMSGKYAGFQGSLEDT